MIKRNSSLATKMVITAVSLTLLTPFLGEALSQERARNWKREALIIGGGAAAGTAIGAMAGGKKGAAAGAIAGGLGGTVYTIVDRDRGQERSKRNSTIIVAGSSGAGAAIGAAAGGTKGAVLGALAGGAGGYIYDRKTNNRD
jgi:hypothetical protein